MTSLLLAEQAKLWWPATLKPHLRKSGYIANTKAYVNFFGWMIQTSQQFKKISLNIALSESHWTKTVLNVSIPAFLHSKNVRLSKKLVCQQQPLSASSPSEAIAKYRESKALLSETGMNFCEYASSSPEVNNPVPEKDRAPRECPAFLGLSTTKKRTDTTKSHISIKRETNQ